jgi:hypothetical protein
MVSMPGCAHFHGLNPIAIGRRRQPRRRPPGDAALALPIPASANRAVRACHRCQALDHLPGSKTRYAGRDELEGRAARATPRRSSRGHGGSRCARFRTSRGGRERSSWFASWASGCPVGRSVSDRDRGTRPRSATGGHQALYRIRIGPSKPSPGAFATGSTTDTISSN